MTCAKLKIPHFIPTKKSSTPKTSQAVIGYSDGDEIKGWPRRWLTEQTVMKKFNQPCLQQHISMATTLMALFKTD